jgi:hypothetical protein
MSGRGEPPKRARQGRRSVRRVLFINVLAEEFRGSQAHFDLFGEEHERTGLRYHAGKLPRPHQWDAVVVQGGPDYISRLILQLLEDFRPTIVVATGIATGLSPHVRAGDVVVASQLSAFGNGKESSRETIVVPGVLQYLAQGLARSGNWRKRLDPRSKERRPHVYIGPLVILTGAPTAPAPSNALAVATLDWGVIQELERRETPVLVVQGIAEVADRSAESFVGRQIAASHSAAYAIEFLYRLDPEVLGGRSYETEQWLPELPYDVGQEGPGPAQRLEDLPAEQRRWFEAAFAEQDRELSQKRGDSDSPANS